MSKTTEFDRQAILRAVQQQADTPVGTIDCPRALCDGRVPLYGDDRSTACGSCGSAMIVGSGA